MSATDLPSNQSIWGSDVIASAIREQGFPYICLNPGASFRGLHDSLVNFLGNKSPEMLVCMHEEHAVGIAHGYALVTNRPLAVFVHSNVGLMHASMAVFNAWCARVPIVIFGATGPVDAALRRPWIDWIHTSADQGALIRNYSKWDDQPGSPVAAVESIRRGTIIATTRPCAPVYINFDATIQEAELAEWPALHDFSQYRSPTPPAPAEGDVALSVEWLDAAQNIVILAGRMSRDSDAWQQRIKLAEKLGATVLTSNLPAAFPTKHPLFFGECSFNLRPAIREALSRADLILALDWFDLGGTLNQIFPPGKPRTAKVINCTMDFQVHNGWSMDYHVLPISDLSIAATAESFTEVVNSRLKAKPNASDGRESAYSLPAMPDAEGEIGIRDLAAVFLNLTQGMDIALLSKPIGWPPNATSVEHPHDLLAESNGGGLGANAAIGIGAALALRDLGSPRIPVVITGDGDFTMGCNAVWTAAHAKIPVLIIVSNNRSYFNDELHQNDVAKTRARPQERAWIGQRIEDPAPNMAKIAEGFGLESAGPVERLEDLSGAINKALSAVRDGKPFLLDVIVKREYASDPIPKRGR